MRYMFFIALLLTGCNQHYPKWYYEAQLSGLESHSCKRAMRQSDGNSKMVPDVCEVAISNAIISRPEYQKTDTPPKIQPLEPLDDIKAQAFKAVSENRYNEAITFFSIAISLEADNKILYYNRGDLHFKSEDYEEALADYDKAISIDPYHSMAYRNRSAAYRKWGRNGSTNHDWSGQI